MILEEAIYGMDGLQIEPRKKNLILPFAVLLAGAALIFAAYKYDYIASNPNLSSGSLLFGFAGIVAGIIMAISALTSKGIPFYAPTKEKLKKYELRFDTELKDKVKKHVAAGDFESLTDLPEGTSSAVKVIIYKTQSGELIIAQVQEYVPHTYRPADDIMIFHKGEYIRSAKLA